MVKSKMLSQVTGLPENFWLTTLLVLSPSNAQALTPKSDTITYVYRL
jgi:hypothetical protein